MNGQHITLVPQISESNSASVRPVDCLVLGKRHFRLIFIHFSLYEFLLHIALCKNINGASWSYCLIFVYICLAIQTRHKIIVWVFVPNWFGIIYHLALQVFVIPDVEVINNLK